MKVPGNSLELPDKISFFIVSPPKGVRWEFIPFQNQIIFFNNHAHRGTYCLFFHSPTMKKTFYTQKDPTKQPIAFKGIIDEAIQICFE